MDWSLASEALAIAADWLCSADWAAFLLRLAQAGRVGRLVSPATSGIWAERVIARARAEFLAWSSASHGP